MMRSRSLARAPGIPPSDLPRRASQAALVFLRGRDADGCLRELGAARAAARPVLGALALAWRERRGHEALGYRSLGDYARERLGVGARVVREWARVWGALRELPRLREAVLAGEVSWTVARLVVGLATPETDAACLETVRGRTVRAVRAIVDAVRRGDASPGSVPEADESAEVLVRVRGDRRSTLLWTAAVELARRVAGEELPLWQCAERIAAEAASTLGAPGEGTAQLTASDGRACGRRAISEGSGLRAQAFTGRSWKPRLGSLPGKLSALAQGLEDASPRKLDRRLRAAVAFLQALDLETGRILRQVRERRLYDDLGCGSFARYCEERLDLAPRTARRLVALARAELQAPAVARAFREGALHGFQAHALLRVADLASAGRWVAHARRVTLRRLEEDVDAEAPGPTVISFRAPASVASLFLAMVGRAGSLERLLAHAITTWVQMGEPFDDYADFERDGFRCTVPGCTARRNLQSHHVRFRSRGGPDVAWNRTTLCAHHHLRSVHRQGVVVIRGRAPEALVFELAGERYRSGDVRM